MPVLADLIRALHNAEIEVVDLTADLSPETPLLPLPLPRRATLSSTRRVSGRGAATAEGCRSGPQPWSAAAEAVAPRD